MAYIPSAFKSPYDEYSGLGIKPVVFDILTPDLQKSLLPDYLKLVLHVNPSSFKISYEKVIEVSQTIGGHVEFHFGDGIQSIGISGSTGGFIRMYTGITSVTGGTGGIDLGGSRRQTIAYDKFLDLLALFHNNGAIYDADGNIFLSGVIKISFDGFSFYGWFQSFTPTDDANKPFQFNYDLQFTVAKELMGLKALVRQTEDLQALSTFPKSEAEFSNQETQDFQRNAEIENERKSLLGQPIRSGVRKSIFDDKIKKGARGGYVTNFNGDGTI